jgi:hypothetical protein
MKARRSIRPSFTWPIIERNSLSSMVVPVWFFLMDAGDRENGRRVWRQ